MNGRQTQGVYAEAQERQAQLTRGFFETSQEVVKRVRRRQSASRNIAKEELADPYVDFLDSLFFYYRESIRATELESIKGKVLP
jgi:hypothetical protein